MPRTVKHQDASKSPASPTSREASARPSEDAGLRLRATRRAEPLHVVLVEPEIPPNTGNVARLCAATESVLHLVHPLGFQVDEKAVRRAGLDYWHLVRLVEHASFADFETSLPEGARLHFFTGKARANLYQTELTPGDYLVFGRESVGLPPDLLARYAKHTVAIPTLGAVRSLNLANAATLAVYEALRQNALLDETALG